MIISMETLASPPLPLIGRKIETIRTYVDNGSNGYMTLYANGVKTYAMSVTGSMISGSYASAQYTFTILKRCRLIIMDFATSTIESDKIREAGYSFQIQYQNYKELFALEVSEEKEMILTNNVILCDIWNENYKMYQFYDGDCFTFNSGNFKASSGATATINLTIKKSGTIKIIQSVCDSGGPSSRVRINGVDVTVSQMGTQKVIKTVNVGDTIEWYSVAYYSSVLVTFNPNE